ncbi:MAG: peroxiredoxin [Aeromicrobium sp.]|nr:peroxiredoxin [Aeromicrobium sp.]
MSLAIGAPAPDFTLTSQHGENISLSSFRGDRHVVLVFFPFAFSGICTGELTALRDELEAFEALGAEIVAISCDHFFANRAFSDRDGLPFAILSDFWPHGQVSRAYGTFNDDIGAPNRSSFVIDRDGVLRWQVVQPIGVARDLGGYRTALSDLS